MNRWAVLYKPCLPSTESWFLSAALPPHFPLPHLQFSLCLFIPDRSVPDVPTQPDLAIPSVLLPSLPQFPYLSYEGSTTSLS